MPPIDNQISTLIKTITIIAIKPSNVTNSTTKFLQNTHPVPENQQADIQISLMQQVSSLVLIAIIFIELALAVGYAYSHSNKKINLREIQTERKMIEGGDDDN